MSHLHLGALSRHGWVSTKPRQDQEAAFQDGGLGPAAIGPQAVSQIEDSSTYVFFWQNRASVTVGRDMPTALPLFFSIVLDNKSYKELIQTQLHVKGRSAWATEEDRE
jgi:hypothetical protein